RPGKLTLKVSDQSARPLTMTSPDHPVLWRDVPDLTDCSIQTDVEMVSVQQGDFISGLILEVQEGTTTSRYVFALEDGDFLRVKRATGGSYSTLRTLNWSEAGAVIRIRRA
ncbi:MAG: hypothetical protein GWO24_33230, partial [Akkermansiaceae bacterium]|nr:hypothetical protein [Akkermansiaceae bacterium]